MICIWKTIPKQTIKKDAKAAIPKLRRWFKQYPERQDCNIALWYGQTITLKRGEDIATAVNAAAERAIGGK
jgi:hypothetical protein